MKNLLIGLTLLFMINSVFAQTDFKWEKTDSIQKTKSQIYTDTKMFIAKTWKSAKDVIQNDDKDAGIILIKGKSVQNFNFALHQYEFIYDYTVTFKMKDGKYKVILENVYCSSAYEESRWQVKKIEPSDEIPYPLETGWISVKKAGMLMESLKAELQAIVDSFAKSMKSTVSPRSSNDNW
jgi:hypothetical protein